MNEEVLKMFLNDMWEKWNKEECYAPFGVITDNWKEKTFAFWLLNKIEDRVT